MKLLMMLAALVVLSGRGESAERKPLAEVVADELIGDTQVTPAGAGDKHAALCWWIPMEFWQALFSRDASTSEADKKNLLSALRDITLAAVVQADISAMGALHFYTKEEIEEHMTISFVDGDGRRTALQPLHEVDPDMEVILGVFKPIMAAALGNLGQNVHFYVLNDRTPKGNRLLDPYASGVIRFGLIKRSGAVMNGEIGLPLNALFVPRKCPNGKDAHISWRFCPWTGTPLE
ncbi:MAG: hypothetical protein WB626_09340 [Bacteroidota bacterium]